MSVVSSYPNDTLIGTSRLLGETAAGDVKNFLGTEVAKLNVEGQVIAGGASYTAKLLSISGSPDVDLVIDVSARGIQYINNIAPFRIAAPTADGSCLLMILNSQSPDGAGAVTFATGYRVGSSTGDSITTTAGAIFTVNIWRVNGISGYSIFAHQ